MSYLVAAVAAKMLEKCEEFNASVIGLPIPEQPTPLSAGRQQWAVTALLEELKEFETANEAGNVLEAADALIDLVYFALGRLVEMGVPAVPVFEEVQRANLEKVRGELSKRPHSKGFDAVKPVDWRGPDHTFLLSFTRDDLRAVQLLAKIPKIFRKIADLREAKGADYNNIPGGRDAYFPFGHFSYAHMVHTKAMRIQSLLASLQVGKSPNFEGLLDSVEDLINYATFYAEWLQRSEAA